MEVMRYSGHALTSMMERFVSLGEVEAVISDPESVEAQGGERNRYQARVGGRLIQVVIEFASDPPAIITVITPEE